MLYTCPHRLCTQYVCVNTVCVRIPFVQHVSSVVYIIIVLVNLLVVVI